MFFDTLDIKWWYEPEGFELRFNYEEFALEWDMSEEELLEEGVPQTFKHLDGRTYRYLPDFYLPELNYWIEVKGPNPTKEELEKAFMLHSMISDLGRKRMREAPAEKEAEMASEDFFSLGVYIFYGDIPWPYPEKGNIFGYGARHNSGSSFLYGLVSEDTQSKETEYRSLLMGQLKLCWQECPLCSKIGIGKLNTPYCRSCYDSVARLVFTHLAKNYGMNTGATLTGRPLPAAMAAYFSSELPEAYEVTKSLINEEYFTAGHSSPKVQKAYEAARSARFEHRG